MEDDQQAQREFQDLLNQAASSDTEGPAESEIARVLNKCFIGKVVERVAVKDRQITFHFEGGGEYTNWFGDPLAIGVEL